MRAMPNAKGLTEVRPLDGLHINRPKQVAGAGFALFRQRRKRVRLK
jgi:hypothetical protein